MALNLLQNYSSDSECDDYVFNNQIELIVKDIFKKLLDKVERDYYLSQYRSQCSSESDSDSDLSPWSVDSDTDSDEESTVCLTKGELTYLDLPKIEKLNISSPIEQLTQIGIVTSLVDQLVIVKSFSNIPPLDLDSTLFFKNGTELGQVFDVIGPVREPCYVIRFNSTKEILESKIEMNMPVYYNAQYPEPYTKYIFLNKLIQERGCDASWKDNNEPPPEALDYSDDETERKEKWKQNAKMRRRKNLI